MARMPSSGNDVNHAISRCGATNRPSLELVAETADFYGLDDVRAAEIIEEVSTAVDRWRYEARRARISRADIEIMAGAFSAHAEHRTKVYTLSAGVGADAETASE